MLKDVISKMEISKDLNKEQQEAIESVISRHLSAFSISDEDIGYCDEISHRIITVDDTPVKVPHRRIPPHQW